MESCSFRYCSGKFACRLPTWGLPSCGHVQGLVAEFAGIEVVPLGGPVAHAPLPGWWCWCTSV